MGESPQHGFFLFPFSFFLPAIILLCCALPVGWIIWQIIANPMVWSELRLDAFRLHLLGRTLLYNALAGLTATLLALPAAMVLGRGRWWAAGALWLVMPVALLMPSIAYAYGWSQFLRLVAVHPEPAGAADVARCIWSLATWLWALPAGIIGLSLRRMEVQVQQQAMLDGALWRVTLRQLAGPIVAAVAVVMLLSMHEYAVYEPTGISVVATEVRMVFDTGAFASIENPMTAPIFAGGTAAVDQRARAAAAVASSVPMLVAIAVLALVCVWALRRTSASDAVDVGRWPRALNAGWIPVVLSLLVVIVALGVPTVSMVLSMKRDLDLWRMFQAVRPQVMGSISIAMATGAVALAVAMGAALRNHPLALGAAVVSFLVGGQMIAIALIRLYNQPWLEWVYNAPPIMVMAYMARFGWIALLAGAATWAGPWRQVREMSAIDGAGAMQTARHVVWPLAWPLAAAAGVLLMVLAVTEVPATVLLSPQRPPMLIPMLMGWVHMLRNDDMLEGALLLMTIVMVLSVIGIGLCGLGMKLLREAGMGRRGT